jgi:ribosomal protein S18 acetylase RimI-like enzyme
MIGVICYSVDKSSAAEIAAHLLHANAGFTPTLSSRVDIGFYAQKLHDKAKRFEAWQGEHLIGLVAAYCNQHDGGTAFVSSVSVSPEQQGQGLASVLMRQCLDYVQGRGFSRIDLEVDQRSEAAIALYKKQGFATLASKGSTLTMSMSFGK